MEPTCQRCHADIVPHDAPFCSNCGLPQLRVSDELSAQAEDAADAESGSAPAARPGDLRADWRFAIRCALSVTVPAIVFFIFGLRFEVAGVMLIFWILAASLIAVVLYHRGRPSLPLNFKVGARIGSITGAVIALLLLIAFSISAFNMRFRTDSKSIDAEYREKLKDISSQYQMTPQMQAFMQSSEFRAGMTVFSAGVYGLILVGMSTITGALGAAVLRTNRFTPR